VRAATLERLTAAAFGQRRKMLRQSLKGLPGALEALATLGIDPSGGRRRCGRGIRRGGEGDRSRLR
jgi:16S rRNA A1518/A1519 N6-dimethyltransferase RsmA/KsgA/DIM1 with predicted DNA glycosylase/AP lyase activity